HVKPVVVPDPPFRRRARTGGDVDLGSLPVPRYFPGDAGRYLTAGMLVARDPETGVETEGYHRFQVKGRDRMGVSLHSRRRMFEYARRAEAKGEPLPCAVVLGLHPLVSIAQSRPGEAKHVIPIVLGVDHYVKLVIVVDEDIDVFDESDVLWAVATRMQADRDLLVISGSLGALLDPSADERGVTAKLGIDATRPFGAPFAEKLVAAPDRMAWARALVDRLGR